MDSAKGFLGVGWKFPVQVDEATGRIKTSSYEEDIQEAIGLIVMTSRGERVMNPQFGCGIRRFVFDDVDYTTINQMQNEVRNTLIAWEPRITDIEVIVETDGKSAGKLVIHVAYVVRATNNPFNLVFPYFMNEGM